MVKADAYGCRARLVAPRLERAGARSFFTATLAEAVRIAPLLGPESALYVLNGYAPGGEWPEDPRIKPVLNTLLEYRAWAGRSHAGKAALQIETGMNRLGATEEELHALWAEATAPSDKIDLILSHLARAEGENDPLLLAQKRRFDALSPRLREAFPAARASLAASSAAILGAACAYDLTRPGVGLYGGLDFHGAEPVLSLSAPILRVWEVEKGAVSGYDAAWKAPRPSRLATIALGYADGVPRSLEGRWRANLAQGSAPLVGRISMDLIVLDVTDLSPGPRAGDFAWLLDQELTVAQMAEAAGTISYEIMTGLDAARRLERRLNSD